jgi:hypothetical protein
VQREAAAEGLDAVGEADEPDEAGATGEVGAAASVVADAQHAGAGVTWTSMTVAEACLAAVVSAAETT